MTPATPGVTWKVTTKVTASGDFLVTIGFGTAKCSGAWPRFAKSITKANRLIAKAQRVCDAKNAAQARAYRMAPSLRA